MKRIGSGTKKKNSASWTWRVKKTCRKHKTSNTTRTEKNLALKKRPISSPNVRSQQPPGKEKRKGGDIKGGGEREKKKPELG